MSPMIIASNCEPTRLKGSQTIMSSVHEVSTQTYPQNDTDYFIWFALLSCGQYLSSDVLSGTKCATDLWLHVTNSLFTLACDSSLAFLVQVFTVIVSIRQPTGLMWGLNVSTLQGVTKVLSDAKMDLLQLIHALSSHKSVCCPFCCCSKCCYLPMAFSRIE